MSKITGQRFLEALADAGVIQRGEHVRRVVIDAQVGHGLILHVQRFGDKRILSVVPTLEGVEITGVPE